MIKLSRTESMIRNWNEINDGTCLKKNSHYRIVSKICKKISAWISDNQFSMGDVIIKLRENTLGVVLPKEKWDYTKLKC